MKLLLGCLEGTKAVVVPVDQGVLQAHGVSGSGDTEQQLRVCGTEPWGYFILS